jgi:probable rRNA maturation factor
MRELHLRNRQRDRRISIAFIRRLSTTLLEELLELPEYELAIHFVSTRSIARLNEQFLQHAGATDVITFNLCANACRTKRIAGEIFICVRVSLEQAKEFRTTWQAEIVRYIVHGILHLLGYDDLQPDKRREMKREENRLVKTLESRFKLSSLGR